MKKHKSLYQKDSTFMCIMDFSVEYL